MMENSQLELAHEFIFHTNRSVFLTGKAGTGKTTFLSRLKKTLPKRMAVVAPTGVAAINAGGVTIHSLFQLPFAPYIPGSGDSNSSSHRFGREKINLIKSLDLLVIDEISMVRADVMDAIDAVLRRYKDRNKPFGGVQLLLIGDLQQLAPVVKEEEWSLLRPYYETVYFFSSQAIRQLDLVRIELTHIYRQSDDVFINLLNKVRDNKLDTATLSLLNERYLPNFEPSSDEGYIRLTTHNASAQKINTGELNQLKAKTHYFDAEITGDFPAYAYPTEVRLELKKGAQVMFVKNDSSREKRFYNGKIGKITSIDYDGIYVRCPGDDDEILVEPATWSNVKYQLNEKTKEVEEIIVGSFTQIPLRLAWAITIHKSQGLTFEKAIIDANLSFAHGQVYVALSRCKSLEGMVLSSPIETQSIRTDGAVLSFSRETSENPPDQQQLSEAKLAYQKAVLFELFDWEDVRRLLVRLQRVVSENSATAPVLEELKNTIAKFDSEVFSVGIKFRGQINQRFDPDGLNNVSLQERIQKASLYFLEKIGNDLARTTHRWTIETDNAVFQKSFNEIKTDLEKAVFVKQACLRSAANGFRTEHYLRTRADAEIDFKPTGAPKNSPLKGLRNSELYADLKNWRQRLAREHNVADYMIIQVKTMMEIANQLPTSISKLANIKGIGKTKAKKFGEDIVRLVRDYCQSNAIPILDDGIPELIDSKPEKIPTRQITLDLFKGGHNMEEIAAQRNLSVGTIESHLLHYIGSGELDVFDVYPAKKVNLILDYLQDNPRATLTEAKASLGDEISYGELRAAASYLKAGQND